MSLVCFKNKHHATHSLQFFAILIALSVLLGCAATPVDSSKPMPKRANESSVKQFAKTDLDRMADLELEENTQSLRLLMTKLYKRNPKELAKNNIESAEKMAEWVFDSGEKHHFLFDTILQKQEIAAIQLAFEPNFNGDRVLALIVGLHTMLQKAHGSKTEFYVTDSLNPQSLYNVARNIEIAAWKLSQARKPTGELYLLSNEINEQERNLSFEREIGKLIGRLDLFAFVLAEKSQRFITRVFQSVATMAFLPF